MASSKRFCPRCGGEVSLYALRCPTCGLPRPGSGNGPTEGHSPKEVTGHLREQIHHRSRGQKSWPPGEGKLLEGAFTLIQEHPLSAGLVSGVVILLVGLMILTFFRSFADPLAKAEKLLRQQADRRQAALRQVREGEEALARGDYPRAYAALGRALELGADGERLRCLRGRAAVELKHYQEAVRDLSLASGRRCLQNWVLRGRAFEALGHYQAALRDFRQARLELPPHSSELAEVHYALAQLHERLGDVPQALEALEQALESGRREAESYLFRGRLKGQLGNEEAALADYGRALTLNPGLAPAYLRRGILQVRLGRWEPAINDLNRALELGLTEAELFSHRGVAYAHLGQTEAARRDLETAVRLGAFEARPALRAVAGREQALRRLAAARPQVAGSLVPKQSHPRRPRRR